MVSAPSISQEIGKKNPKRKICTENTISEMKYSVNVLNRRIEMTEEKSMNTKENPV